MTKIEAARQEYADWCSAIGIDTLQKVNETLLAGKAIPLINLCEARQERKYAEIANEIYWLKDKTRIVMMSGPSSSGKTSSSLRSNSNFRIDLSASDSFVLSDIIFLISAIKFSE